MNLEHADLRLQQLTSLDQIDQLFSIDGPVLIFKHSPTCGISAQAHGELTAVLDERLPLAAAYVVLVSNRAVSRELSGRASVRHESPQVLLLASGTVRWHTSHFGVTAERVRAAIKQISREQSAASEFGHSSARGITPTMLV